MIFADRDATATWPLLLDMLIYFLTIGLPPPDFLKDSSTNEVKEIFSFLLKTFFTTTN